MKRLLGIIISIISLAGCAPEIGSEEWCEDMKEKPKGDWTANEAKDFTKYCLLKLDKK
jgi:DUF3012 family protein